MAAVFAGLTLSASATLAQDKTDHPGVTPARWPTKGAPVPEGEMKRVITPGAPDMTQAEFDIADQLYFERCAVATASCARARPASR